MLGQKRRLRDRMGQPATLVGPDVRIEGRIEGKGHVLVSGTVIGDADVEGAVTLAEGGRWEGQIRAADVVVAGELKGEINATDCLEITARAKIEGRISAGRIAMAEGSVVDGEMRITGDGEIKRFEDRRSGPKD
jgi:cytoskeletal protein CcmA (bactofilin family)